MSNTPGSAEELNFKDGYNFVNISRYDWQQKLLYYCKHEEEARKIAEQGRETILKYHTHTVRAQQFIKLLKFHDWGEAVACYQ